MPGQPDRPHRMRVRVLDGKPRDPNKLKGQLVPHVSVIDVQGKIEFVICASKETHLAEVRAKLSGAGLEDVVGGSTSVAVFVPPRPARPQATRRDGPQHRGQQQRDVGRQPSETIGDTKPLSGKPYGFVGLPSEFTTATPVWNDGTCSQGRLSGEVRLELETLTPLLVGWERGIVGDAVADHPVPVRLEGAGQLAERKSVLCPLRAPWGQRPVILPGDSLKGLLRHELGALLGAPMERVAERSYSYRPNALFPQAPNPRLIARLARVPRDGVEMMSLNGDLQVRVPRRLELLPGNLRYDWNRSHTADYYRFDDGNGEPYRGGQGAGQKLNSTRRLHSQLTAKYSGSVEMVDVPGAVKEGYLATLRHLTDDRHGHFSERHPNHAEIGQDARRRILKAASSIVFQPGDLIWVEWDTRKKQILSLGWHYYYRWAYTDTIRHRQWAKSEECLERHGLFPLPEEQAFDEITSEGKHRSPKALSGVRRLLGYTSAENDEGSAGIGSGDYAQLMGRVSVNSALEVVSEGDREETRFLKPTFLKELGMPRPSAVEHYLKQPYHPGPRPSDQATLVTYGDATGYDAPGELAGRKFYLDREDAYTGTSRPWNDDSQGNRENPRSTLALEASNCGRRFRFTIRFRDLDPVELAAIMVALCPHQFRKVLRGTHTDGYCSKLGYARPLGWGTVRIDVKSLLFLDDKGGKPDLKVEADHVGWVTRNHRPPATQTAWLSVHRHKNPEATDYPRQNGEIFTFHTSLRANHSRMRRFPRDKRQ